jgi:hypothetical protein
MPAKFFAGARRGFGLAFASDFVPFKCADSFRPRTFLAGGAPMPSRSSVCGRPIVSCRALNPRMAARRFHSRAAFVFRALNPGIRRLYSRACGLRHRRGGNQQHPSQTRCGVLPRCGVVKQSFAGINRNGRRAEDFRAMIKSVPHKYRLRHSLGHGLGRESRRGVGYSRCACTLPLGPSAADLSRLAWGAAKGFAVRFEDNLNLWTSADAPPISRAIDAFRGVGPGSSVGRACD